MVCPSGGNPVLERAEEPNFYGDVDANMFGPVSIVYPEDAAGYTALTMYIRSSSAVSPAAMAAKNAAKGLVASAEVSQVLFGDKATALSQLWTLALECSQPDWDGADASAIDNAAIMNAENVIRALPANIPMPELTPEPDGAVSLDWIESRHRIFSVSVGAGSRLAYAWLDGSDRGHGVAWFDGDTIPARVLEGIRGIISHGKTIVRPFLYCR